MSKKARDEILRILDKLDEKKSKVAKLFFNDFLKATDSFERKVYKARLYNFLCRDCRDQLESYFREGCKKLKALLDELG